MKSYSIVLNAPITEYCTKCGYEAHKSFYSYSSKCPSCGNSSISYGPKKNNEILKFYVSSGSYGIKLTGELADKEWCYTFYNIPYCKNLNIYSSEECEYDDIFDVIDWLASNKYSVRSSSYNHAIELKKYIDENPEWKERQYILMANERRQELEAELYKLNLEYGFYNEK